jgi:hypothetical protein
METIHGYGGAAEVIIMNEPHGMSKRFSHPHRRFYEESGHVRASSS